MSAPQENCAIDIRAVSKYYGETAALKNISMQIRDNEFFTLLGPSGCGKTTLLRIIAGFEEASGGEIFLFGREIESLPPHQRPVNTVFQNYALFPHMTVMDNILFGLRMQNIAPAAAAARAAAMLELVRLTDYAARRPAQLSGGQQQRVALARALAPAPKALLLDESLSALDLKLRQAMRVELKQIQRETGITFIFVTHDQDEALTMSDRVAIMAAGEVRQIGAPRDIYDAPASRFVADFIGEVNLLAGRVSRAGGQTLFIPDGEQPLAVAADGGAAGAAADGACHAAIRPERARLTEPAAGELRGVIEQNIYIGAITEVRVRLRGGALFAVRMHNAGGGGDFAPGQETGIVIEEGAARLLRR